MLLCTGTGKSEMVCAGKIRREDAYSNVLVDSMRVRTKNDG